jgi:hypothetical protein
MSYTEYEDIMRLAGVAFMASRQPEPSARERAADALRNIRATLAEVASTLGQPCPACGRPTQEGQP